MTRPLLAIAVAVALAAFGGAAACHSDIDADKLAAAITAALAAHDLPLASLACPRGQAYQVGAAFDCTGTTVDQQPVTVTVTQREHRDLQWALAGMELHTSRVRAEILPKLGSGYEVTCPHEVGVVAIGEWTRCTLKRAGVIGHLDVKIDDLEGNESYKVEPL